VAAGGVTRGDQWLAVAVTTDEQWRRLCAVIGAERWAGLDGAERRARRRELDQLVGAWSAGQDPWKATVQLQELGIPAHQVQNGIEAFADPQLRHRGHYVEVPHRHMGTTWVEDCRYRFDRTPARACEGSPTLGEHTWEVLTGILGYDEDRVVELAAAEVLE
jgi:benzylsuccinate CoA-transferase BbsF subunit